MTDAQLYCYSMPNGGHLYHARPITVGAVALQIAICGYSPSSPRGRQFRRGYWSHDYQSGDPSMGRPTEAYICPKCLRKLRKLGVID